MPGPPPKQAGQRQRRNRSSSAARLEAAPAAKASLPPSRVSAICCSVCPLPAWSHGPKGFEETGVEHHDFMPAPLEWRPETAAWWGTIWASPMAAEWVDADVPGLQALAMLVDEFWRTADRGVHAEIRMASREFGLSPFSRRQLQWEIHKVETAARPPTASVTPRRRGRAALSVLSGKSA